MTTFLFFQLITMTDDNPELEEKYNLVTRGLAQVLDGKKIMKKIMAARPFRIYWGTAPTGQIHIGYLVPLMKIADFLDAGCEVTILIADIHATLDALKSTQAQVASRAVYYEKVIQGLLRGLGVDISKLRFVRGSDFQYERMYREDEDILSTSLNVRDCIKSGAEVVKQSDNPKLSGLRYPPLQCLDEAHLGVDAQFGGEDQLKIFGLSSTVMKILRTVHKKIKTGRDLTMYRDRIHLTNPMISPLCRFKRDDPTKPLKMSSSSDATAKIGIIDTKKQVRSQIATAFCEPGNVEDNTPLTLTTDLLFPMLWKMGKKGFEIKRPEEYGGDVTYETPEQMREAFTKEELSPVDLKSGMADFLISFLDPIRTSLLNDAEFCTSCKTGYNLKVGLSKTQSAST